MKKEMSQVRCFLLDMDGTIYLDNRPFEGAVDAVERMKKQGKVLFLTNNSVIFIYYSFEIIWSIHCNHFYSRKVA